MLGRRRGEAAVGLSAGDRRTLATFCEAMAPGHDGLPAAGRDADVLAPIDRFLATLPARDLGRWKLILRTFERLPFPRRFSRLGLEDRERFLERLEGSRFRPFREILVGLKTVYAISYAALPAVRERVGYEVSCRLADGSTPEPPGSLGDLDPQGDGEECDVVIVGSGAGGAPAASVLAEAGLDVLVLEGGEYHDRDSYSQDPLETTIAMGSRAIVTQGRPAITLLSARAVGGSTTINSGTCFRAPPSVLSHWAREYGLDWATDLDAEYAEAERFMSVTELDPQRMGRNGQLAKQGAEALGASGGPVSRNAGDCVQCSSCPFGCALDARRSMHVSYLPRAVAAGARVRRRTEARRILLEGGRAVGVECVARAADGEQGRPYVVRARRAVIAACGALRTPELLLRSKLGGGQVGRNLHIHPGTGVGALYDEPVRGWDGVMQSYFIDEWQDEGVLLEATFAPLPYTAGFLPGTGRSHQQAMLDFDRVGLIAVQLSDKSSGRVLLDRGGSLRVRYRLGKDDLAALWSGLARAAEVHFAAGATEVYANVRGGTVLKPPQLAEFERSRVRAADLHPEAYHPMGTARISSDPATGVCSPDGAVQGVEGLYVADASLFPSSVAVNPMMTVIAVSKRISSGIADRI